MPDPNLRLLEEAAGKLAPFLNEIVFVGGVILGLMMTDPAAAPIRSTNDVDVIAMVRVVGRSFSSGGIDGPGFGEME